MEENWNLDIDSYQKRFCTCDGATLADKDLPPTKYVIRKLLPQGLALLSGSPKVGKSWLTLDWCVKIAKGEKIWDFPTVKGTTLYLSLEDTESRLQERLLTVTEDAPSNVHFATSCLTIGDGLEEQIRTFVSEHPETVLIAIDIFLKVRANNEVSYSVDYSQMEVLKKLAHELKITILLVHHVRKEKADDPFDMISGTNGLVGCADTEFVLLKSKRSSGNATLHCTGRDIEDREIELHFDKETCTWEYISDSVENPELVLPKELQKLVEMMKEISFFSGSNADFLEKFNRYAGTDIKANALKRKMNHWRLDLEELGVTYESKKSNNIRNIHIQYEPPVNDS